MRLLWRLRQGLSRTMTEGSLHFGPLFGHLGQAERLCTPPCDDDDVDSWRQEIRLQAKTLATDALDTVSHDRVADLPRDDQPEPALAPFGKRRSSRDEEYEVSRGSPSSLAGGRLNALEVRVSAHLSVAPQRVTSAH
jgi:hypothetical protein